MGSTHLGSTNPRKFQKSRDFLRALSGGFTFYGTFSKRAAQILSTKNFLFETNIGLLKIEVQDL